jgi:hypothetical protein
MHLVQADRGTEKHPSKDRDSVHVELPVMSLPSRPPPHSRLQISMLLQCLLADSLHPKHADELLVYLPAAHTQA